LTDETCIFIANKKFTMNKINKIDDESFPELYISGTDAGRCPEPSRGVIPS